MDLPLVGQPDAPAINPETFLSLEVGETRFWDLRQSRHTVQIPVQMDDSTTFSSYHIKDTLLYPMTFLKLVVD